MPASKWTGTHPCEGGCGKDVWKAGAAHGCCNACYQRRRYATDPEFRGRALAHNRRWQIANPAKWVELNRRSTKAHYEQQLAKGLCRSCDQPLQTKWHCATHAAEHSERSRAYYRRKQQKAQEAA